MLRDDDRIRLQHMRDAAREAISFAAGRDRSHLDSDRMLARALINAAQEIGEAAVRTSKDTRDSIPQIPWPAIVKMRNVLVHVYWGIDNDKLWDTVCNDLPVLLAQLEPLLTSPPASEK